MSRSSSAQRRAILSPIAHIYSLAKLLRSIGVSQKLCITGLAYASSSLADEKHVGSFLLSTAARDPEAVRVSPWRLGRSGAAGCGYRGSGLAP